MDKNKKLADYSHKMNRIYLDYNATAPVFPDVIALMTELISAPHNASAVHGYGRDGRKYVERARTQIAKICDTEPNQVIFNSGATEGNNTVLRHFKTRYPDEQILVSAIEHAAVRDVLEDAAHIPVDENGIVDLAALEKLLQEKKTSLVSVMMVNNETGVIQPIKEIAELTHRHGALFHSDCVQAAGRIPLHMGALGIDFLTLSAHKFGGPQGVGALVFGSCGETPTLLVGGGQERAARAGTENVPGIAGFGLACEIAQKNLDGYQKLEALRDDLEKRLKDISPNIKIYGEDAPRAVNTSMFSLPGITSERLLIALDLKGIAVSNGSACSSGTVHPSHVLKAMGADDTEAASAIRVSMGWDTTQDDVEIFLTSWDRITKNL